MTGFASGLLVIFIANKKHIKISNYKIIFGVITIAVLWEVAEWLLLILSPETALTYDIYSSSIVEAVSDVVSNMIGRGSSLLFVKS